MNINAVTESINKPSKQHALGQRRIPMIITTVTSNDFHDAFNKMRPNQFSYDALDAMFEYLEDLSEDIGEPFKLDVIALACEWVEYGSMASAILEYWDIETREDLRDWTIVIDLDDGGLVMQRF